MEDSQRRIDTVGGQENKVHPLRRSALLLLFALAVAATSLYPQDLTPRAYVISPVGSHAVILSGSFSRGNVLIDPTVPVEDFTGRLEVPSLGYYQSFNLLGRSSNLTLILPYAHGDYEGTLDGSLVNLSRSGLADARVRFSVNLNGGPAMNAGEFQKWREKRLIGASLTVSMPTGQYDPARLANPSTNRWGFKPEIGYSRRWGHWVADWYTGVWFFTANHKFYPGQSLRTQKPVGAVEGHLAYYVKPRLWASFDANFWAGNRSTVNGVDKRDQQRNSRVGGTVSIPVSRRSALKFSYSQGAYVTIGGDFKTLSAGWQYSWIGWP